MIAVMEDPTPSEVVHAALEGLLEVIATSAEDLRLFHEAINPPWECLDRKPGGKLDGDAVVVGGMDSDNSTRRIGTTVLRFKVHGSLLPWGRNAAVIRGETNPTDISVS